MVPSGPVPVNSGLGRTHALAEDDLAPLLAVLDEVGELPHQEEPAPVLEVDPVLGAWVGNGLGIEPLPLVAHGHDHAVPGLAVEAHAHVALGVGLVPVQDGVGDGLVQGDLQVRAPLAQEAGLAGGGHDPGHDLGDGVRRAGEARTPAQGDAPAVEAGRSLRTLHPPPPPMRPHRILREAQRATGGYGWRAATGCSNRTRTLSDGSTWWRAPDGPPAGTGCATTRPGTACGTRCGWGTGCSSTTRRRRARWWGQPRWSKPGTPIPRSSTPGAQPSTATAPRTPRAGTRWTSGPRSR